MITANRQPQPRQELQTYEACLPQLLKQHEGEYVVIRGTDVLRYFPSYGEALEWAYAEFGLEPFFVKRIFTTEQNTMHFTRDLGP